MGNIPTLEEVKEYFKNVETVECLSEKVSEDISKNVTEEINLWNNEYWIRTKESAKGCGSVEIWNCKKGYSKILTHKQPTYTITKDIIEKYQMKDEFPDVFEVKLEVGRWYKVIDKNGQFKSNEFAIIFFDNNENHFGFGYYGTWTTTFKNLKKVIERNTDEVTEATEQEVFEALKNEAVKNYKIGQYIFDEWSKIQATIERLDKFDFSYKTLFVLNDNNSKTALFCNGKWATIIPTLTKKEAEEKLNCKII
ncbi:hypothetical protein [Flavobacterium sp.]|uniref:hypothetical protein n=1 Tax=Flavobacterium sp. TaxID=239 RepID=UPI0037514FC4